MSPVVPLVVAAVGAFVAASCAMVAVWQLGAHRVPRPTVDAPLLVVPPTLAAPTRLLGALAAPVSAAGRERLRRELVQAGFDERRALPVWLAFRGSAALLPVVPGLAFASGRGSVAAVLVLVSAVAVGYAAPGLALHAVQQWRRRQVQRAVPTLLDMLVSTLGAGLSLEASLEHVTGEIARVSPTLGVELERVRARVATGATRHDALRELADRTGVDDVEDLVGLLGPSERFGTAVVRALRAQAETARRRRLLVAEQRATRTAGLLTVLMIMVVLPAVLVVLVGPMAVEVFETLVGGAS